MHRHIFRQDAIFHETDHRVLGILVNFLGMFDDFAIYSNGTKAGTLHNTWDTSAPFKRQCIEVVIWSGQYRKREAESCELVPVVPGGEVLNSELVTCWLNWVEFM